MTNQPRTTGVCAAWARTALACAALGLLTGLARAQGAQGAQGTQGSQAALPALAPLQSVAALDVPRYMGTWHEVAKYPNRFQKTCISSTQATYTLQAGGRVQVLNRCKTDTGAWRDALGAARQIGGPTSAKLKVRFAPEWLSFLPQAWGDYWVILLDPGYQWVVVSEPQREFLWILSRTPQLPEATYQALLAQLDVLGFDLKKLDPSLP